ncbi:MAG TPA: HAD family phosphatase [candidate division Zixibacteria bacterium]|nr:HAD family phosphatase [candidate division Zixibacteria bacterium]
MNKNHNITTLFTDIGGVLLTNGWDHIARRQAVERFNLDLDEVNERHHLTFDTYEEGKLSLDEYMQRVIFYTERTFSPSDFRKFMLDQSQPLDGMMSLLTNLRKRYDLKTVAVSNEGRELTDYRIKQFHLGKLIDFFVSSCFVHVRKPDPDIFRLALDVSQTLPDRVAYIDDRPMFVEIACSLGIHGIHHTGLESTRKALVQLGFDLSDPNDEIRKNN